MELLYFNLLYKGKLIPFKQQKTFFKKIFVCNLLMHSNSYIFVSI